MRFSDECSIRKNAGGTQEWSLNYPHERHPKEIAIEVIPSQSRAQMVCVSI
jgi:hypothetical protein